MSMLGKRVRLTEAYRGRLMVVSSDLPWERMPLDGNPGTVVLEGDSRVEVRWKNGTSARYYLGDLEVIDDGETS